MEFLKNIFGDKTSKEVKETYLSWTPLISLEEINTIIEISKALKIAKETSRRKVQELKENGAIRKLKKKILVLEKTNKQNSHPMPLFLISCLQWQQCKPT